MAEIFGEMASFCDGWGLGNRQDWWMLSPHTRDLGYSFCSPLSRLKSSNVLVYDLLQKMLVMNVVIAYGLWQSSSLTLFRSYCNLPWTKTAHFPQLPSYHFVNIVMHIQQWKKKATYLAYHRIQLSPVSFKISAAALKNGEEIHHMKDHCGQKLIRQELVTTSQIIYIYE